MTIVISKIKKKGLEEKHPCDWRVCGGAGVFAVVLGERVDVAKEVMWMECSESNRKKDDADEGWMDEWLKRKEKRKNNE
jgi:hypothetical protein